MIKILLWKKLHELLHNPIKFLVAIFLPSILIIFYGVNKVDFEQLFATLPLVSALLGTFVLYSIDDVAQLDFYLSLGIKTKFAWYVNIIFIVAFEYVAAEISLFAVIFMTHQHISFQFVILNLFSSFIAACMIGLSTLQYMNYSKMSSYVASFFAILNFGFAYFPLLLTRLNLTVRHFFFPYLAFDFVCGILFVLCCLVMNKQKRDELVINIGDLSKVYSSTFFEA